jgi:putative transposase
VPRLKKIWADAAYRGKELAAWCLQQGNGWALEVVERDPGTRGFQVQPRRWVVERSFAWLSRNRRLAKDYERKVQTSEMLLELAAIRLLLRRLARNRSNHRNPHHGTDATESVSVSTGTRGGSLSRVT